MGSVRAGAVPPTVQPKTVAARWVCDQICGMIRIQLSRSTVASTRIAISPLSELIGAVELLHRHGSAPAPWPYTHWAEQARAVLRTMPQSTPLWIYSRLLESRRRQRTPDAFYPVTPPTRATPRLLDELNLLRRTPRSTIDAQFAAHYPDGAPPWLAIYQQDPNKSFTALTESLLTFWQRAMLPYWPRMLTALEEEVLFRARAIATGGPETMLGELGGIAGWKPPVLSLPKARDSRITTAHHQLLLVPTLFAEHQATCSTDQPALLRLTYQSRGAAVLASDAVRAPGTGTDRLGRLVGERRAQVLRGLYDPATTASLAAVLGLPTSTVSEQLTALHDAGVLYRRRAGRQVFYGLERAGRELLATFDPARIDPAMPNRFSS